MYMRAETKKSILNARQNEHNRQQKEKEKKTDREKRHKIHTRTHLYIVDSNTQRQIQMVKMFSFCCLSALFKLQ